MPGVVKLILFWLVFVLAVTGLNELSKLQSAWGTAASAGPVRDGHQEKIILSRLKQTLHDRDYLAALKIIDQYHRHFANLPKTSSPQAHEFFYLKGHAHSALWQHIEAEQSWKTSLRFAEDRKQKQRIKRLLTASKMLVSDVNIDRTLNNVYMATPHTGPAGALTGKVAVIYVFLTDGALNKWSIRKRDTVLNSWAKAEQWLIERAKPYNINLSFSRRIFLVEKNPHISRLQVGDFDNQNEHANKVAHLVAEHLGAKTLLNFIEMIKQEEQADQAVLIFHLARDGRSFSQRCIYQCDDSGEYVYLMQSASGKRFNFMNYSQAHETLHLFGADDLYNIQAAKHYKVRDIMNYPASNLAANTLEPITAFAIGIQSKQPSAPFDIQVY